MKRFLVALQFLTIFPVKSNSQIKKEDIAGSLFYFPVVGLVIGLTLAAMTLLFDFLPGLVLAALILGASVLITGGFHLDGFADTCDGFYGSRPRERILEIMRDSALGAMGAIGITVLLILKFALLVSIPREILWKWLILMAAFGRFSQVFACHITKYAREEGKARFFVEYAGKKQFFFGLIFTLGFFFFLANLKGIIAFFGALAAVYVFINYGKRKIGGMTGDTIGATSEIAEVLVLFLCLLLQRINLIIL